MTPPVPTPPIATHPATVRRRGAPGLYVMAMGTSMRNSSLAPPMATWYLSGARVSLHVGSHSLPPYGPIDHGRPCGVTVTLIGSAARAGRGAERDESAQRHARTGRTAWVD